MNKLVKQFMLISFLVGIIPPASAQFDNVGSIIFPTSESGEAQQSFLRGVAILHSFGWEQAQEQFQRAQEIAPDFAMAYWGESLAYNHPLFSQMDATEPRNVLQRLGATPEIRMSKAPTETADAKGNAGAGSAGYPQPWTTPKNAIEAEEARAAFAQPWTDGSETDWSAYDKDNHEKNLEQKAAWSGVLGEWDAANEPHRAVYVPKKVYRHRGAPTTMAQAGRGIALPGE